MPEIKSIVLTVLFFFVFTEISILSILFATIFFNVVANVSPASNEELSQIKDFKENHAEFTNQFYSTLIKQNDGNSIAFSPFSIQSLFSMLYLGVKGSAANELLKGFHLGTSNRNLISKNFKNVHNAYINNEQLKISNKIYVDSHGTKLKPEYENIIKNNYNSEVESIDLQNGEVSSNIVNNWIKENTNGKIEKLINPEDCTPETKLILLNAIYFKGSWEAKFNKNNTKKSAFWIEKEKSIECDMMNTQTIFPIKKSPKLKATVIELPYSNSDLSMLLFVPLQKDGLSHLEQKLKEESIDYLEMSNSMQLRSVNLFLPRFKVESNINLKNVLQDINVKEIFSGGDYSDLVTSDTPMRVGKAVHKAIVEVNEEGTEASAATGSTVVFRSGPLPVVVDRPFIFIIKNKSGQNFFMGRVLGKEFQSQ